MDEPQRKSPAWGLLILVLLVVSACASREQITAQHQERCASYGFAPGTEGFATCMMSADMQRRDHIDARRRDIINSVPDMPMRTPH